MARAKSKRAAKVTREAAPAARDARPTAAQKPELLFEREVMGRCRVKSRAQLFKLERAGLFPKRKRYGMRRIAWTANDVDAWITMGADGWKSAHPTEPHAAGAAR